MKVIELVSENFKRLSVTVKLDGKGVTVQGKNGVGKSSFIDSIWVALTGKDIPKKPIQQGKDSAKISVTLKDDNGVQYIAERAFRESGGTLTVKTLSGDKFSTPQKFLDEKIGAISFDPFEFINKQPREQKKFLMDLLGIDLSELDSRKEVVLSERTALSRSYKVLAQAGSAEELSKKYESGLVEKSSDDLIKRMKENQEEIKRMDTILAKIASLKKDILQINDQIRQLNDKKDSMKQELQLLTADCSATIERIDLAEEIAAIDAHNKRVVLNKQVLSRIESLKEAGRVINEKSAEIKKIEAERINVISKAKMPIEGLEFGDDGLLFNGLPLTEEQLSSAKLIEIGLKISIALNPRLRIIRIKDGSLLDSSMLAIIRSIAKESDYQLFIERVTDNDEIGFVIDEND